MTPLKERIAFVGPGVMAEAMIAGLLRQGVALPATLWAAGPREGRLQELRARYGIHTTPDNAAAARQAEVLVLAVKPQRLEQALRQIGNALPPQALVLSIVAGATTQWIARRLGRPAVVRAMPNTPAQIGQGITVWTATAAVTPAQRQAAERILGALGETVYLEDEDYLDMATALSGTGPAYVFLFMEALVDAGVHLGFPRRIAERLVAQTVLGSAAFYRQHQGQAHLAHLRNQVTSPGGTSAAALYYLEKAGFRTAISRAVWAAYERARQLGRDTTPHAPEEP